MTSTPHAYKSKYHRGKCNQKRKQADVEQPKPRFQFFNILAQAELHSPQLFANAQQLTLELVNFLGLSRA